MQKILDGLSQGVKRKFRFLQSGRSNAVATQLYYCSIWFMKRISVKTISAGFSIENTIATISAADSFLDFHKVVNN
jgi:hypothetical protein